MTNFVLKPRWDIFCKIVDNFGDIGVCWRLARQLHAEHGLQVRLWVDDWAVAQHFLPSLKNTSVVEGVSFLHWHDVADFCQAADVVVEAFSCELPPAYLAAMVQQKSKWINLEYLSAETWVDDFHAKPSPQSFLNSAIGLTRYFYFPGFTEATGGLLREREVAAETQNQLDMSFWRKRESMLNFHQKWIPAFAGMTEDERLVNILKISLFFFFFVLIKDLFTALQSNTHKVEVYIPESSILPEIADFFGEETIGVGDYLSRNSLHVHILPFLSQADYDKLLRDCDINFVRGEDSWIRAIWAGKPFIWQPYLQTENTHIKKLDAFLDLFYRGFSYPAENVSIALGSLSSSFPRKRESSPITKNKMDSRLRENDGIEVCDPFDVVTNIHHAWMLGAMPTKIWQNYLVKLFAIKGHTQAQAERLAQQPDLATKLVIFCNQL